ncbi:hypothetical protein BJV82DRAFT_591807 [Fennellomyces sp. T-0311]|nr:hypothetical protein BJV82DRAFT_591807 [Fennellomyces sp. T-0311]
MELTNYYDPFYAASAIFRLLVHLTYFVKIKTDFRRYDITIWLLALWTFIGDAVYISWVFTRETCCDEQPSEIIGLLINHNSINKKWIAVIVYWRMLDQTVGVSQIIKSTYNRCKPVVPSLILLVVLQFTSDTLPDMKFFDDNILAVFMCNASIITFLIMAWKSAVGKRSSFLIFGCIFTQLPVSYTFKDLSFYLSKYSFFTTPIAQKIQFIILFAVSQAENLAIVSLLMDTYHQKLLWPDLKGTKRPRDAESAIEISAKECDEQLVNIDCAIKA